MKKLLFLLVLMVSVSMILSFSAAETTKKEVTLTYWNRYSADPMKAGMQKLISDFEAKYPWIKIEENSTSDADYKTALPVVLASKEPPDFFYWYGGKALKQFVDAGLVYDLNNYYSKFGWEKGLDPASLEVVNYDGVYYAVPTEESMTLLYVNKTKFKEMGLDYPKHDEIISWEEFLNLCEKIKNKGVTPIILGNGDQWCSQLWSGYVIANNLGVDAYYDVHTGKKPFNDPDVVASLDIIDKDLLKKGYFNDNINGLDYFASLEPFIKNGAFFMGQVWMEQFIVMAMGEDKIELDYMLFPRINPKVDYAVEKHIEGIQVMSAKTKHPDETALWLDFIISEEAAEKWGSFVPYLTPTISAQDKASERNFEVNKSMDGYDTFWMPDHIINRAFVVNFYAELGAFFGQIQDAKTTLNNLQDFAKELDYVGAR
jgi:ABC-type glycerol-3-phosphate transport system substrate-binding protein